MARAKRPAAPRSTPAATPKKPDDLAVLFPDVEIEVRLADGSREKVTVRELRFGEYIKYAAELARVQAAVKGAFARPDPDLGVIIDALAACQEDMVTLALAATGKDREWLDSLSSADGEALLAHF